MLREERHELPDTMIAMDDIISWLDREEKIEILCADFSCLVSHEERREDIISEEKDFFFFSW